MRVMTLTRLTRMATALLVWLATSSCLEWKQLTTTPEDSVQRFISLVQTVDGTRTASLVAGALPTAANGAQVTAILPAQVLRGGTVQTTLVSTTPFSRALFGIPGINDHWELTLAAPVTSVTVLIVISTEMPQTSFNLRLGGGSAASIGPYQSTDLSVIFVGTGEIQTNVTWDSPADVDLHLLDPSGKEIYYASRTSTTGGQLDLDSNAACGTDGPRAENIFWPDGIVVPHGEYILRVDYWSSCNASSTNYTVTINLRGLPPKIYTGTFTGTGTGGSAGAGKTVAIFTY
jgi:hypothetical protein